jgi:hypothetical protein
VFCTTWFHANTRTSCNGITPSCRECSALIVSYTSGFASYRVSYISWFWQSITFHVFIHTGLVLHKQACTIYCYISEENCWIASSFGQLICLCYICVFDNSSIDLNIASSNTATRVSPAFCTRRCTYLLIFQFPSAGFRVTWTFVDGISKTILIFRVLLERKR